MIRTIDALAVKLCESLPLDITIFEKDGYCTKPLLEKDLIKPGRGIIITKVPDDRVISLKDYRTGDLTVCFYCRKKSSDEYLCSKKTYTGLDIRVSPG